MPLRKKDKHLLQSLKNPKTRNSAFSDLLDLYQEKIYWHIRKIVIKHEDASDVLQNTFIRVFRGIDKFRGDSSMQTWIYRIAYNESIRFLEKNKNRNNSLCDVSIEYLNTLQEDNWFDGGEVQTKLNGIIAQLSDKQKLVFQMKYFDDLSFKEISEITSINENTLKSTYYTVVKIIEEKMIPEV